jgi:lipooligosaccharide transport system permease protein
MIGLLGNISPRAALVWRRDAEVYMTTWLVNVLPPLLEPLFYLLAFGFGFGVLVGGMSYKNQEVSYLQYLAPGIISIAVMFQSFFECTYGSFVRMYYQKTFDAIICTPLTLEDVVAGEILWGATKSVVGAGFMLVVVKAFGLAAFPDLLLVPLIAFVGGLLFASLAMVFTAICPTIETFNFPMFVLITPMWLISGTFFPVDLLPPWARIIGQSFPLTHVSTLVRAACLGRLSTASPADLVWLAGQIIVFFPLSIYLMKRRLLK